MTSVAFHVRELLYLGRGLRAYARRRTPSVRDKLAPLLRLRDWQRYKRRRDLAGQLPSEPGFAIPEPVGALDLTGFDLTTTAAALAAANTFLAQHDLPALRREAPDLAHFVFDLSGELRPGHPILDLALHPKLLAIASRYLGMLPVIEGISIWYSPNDRNISGSSQYYHLDGQDIRTLQVILLLNDTDLDGGPFTYITAEASARIAKSVGYRKNELTRRLDDQQALTGIDPQSDVRSLTGPAGTLHVVDTDRCLHFGSREGKRSRAVLAIQYYTPFALVLPPRWDQALPFAPLAAGEAFDEVESLVLGSY